MEHLYPIPSSQGSHIIVEEWLERVAKPETVADYKVTVTSWHNMTTAPMKSQQM